MDYESFSKRFSVSRETYDDLIRYCDLLLHWQRRINLISPHSITHIWERHILDSCQFASYLVSRETKIVDFGSGAGLPAVILSILGYNNIHLIESDQRKVIFLEEVKRQLSLSYVVHTTRIEKTALSDVDIITARGCASLSNLLLLASRFLSPHTICCFAKGKNYDKEIEDAQKKYIFHYNAHPSITDPEAAILELSNIIAR